MGKRQNSEPNVEWVEGWNNFFPYESGDWHHVSMSNAAVCNIGVTYFYWSMSQKLLFWSSSLIMAFGTAVEDDPKFLTTREISERSCMDSGCALALAWQMQPLEKGPYRWKTSFILSLSLTSLSHSFCNSDFKIDR